MPNILLLLFIYDSQMSRFFPYSLALLEYNYPCYSIDWIENYLFWMLYIGFGLMALLVRCNVCNVQLLGGTLTF